MSTFYTRTSRRSDWRSRSGWLRTGLAFAGGHICGFYVAVGNKVHVLARVRRVNR